MGDRLLSRRAFLVGSAALSVAYALGLTGCGNSEPQDTRSFGGGTITASFASTTDSFHPCTATAPLALSGNLHVVEPLYESNPTSYEVMPALADGFPRFEDDGTCTIKIREDARFSTGAAVTAGDVVASYERFCTLNPTLAQHLDFISDMQAVDDATIALELARPFSFIEERLQMVKVFPATQSFQEASAAPIGSGPWRYASFEKNKLVFLPNNSYNGPHTVLDNEMDWSVITDDVSRVRTQNDGWTMAMQDVPGDSAVQLNNAGMDVDITQGFNAPFFAFRTDSGPFADARVRQAVFYAIDTQELVDRALSGRASVPTCFLPVNHPDNDHANTLFSYDPDRARQLLSDAGVSQVSFTLDCTDDAVLASIVPQIKSNLEDTGVFQVTVRTRAAQDLYNTVDAGGSDVVAILDRQDPLAYASDACFLMEWWYKDERWMGKRTGWSGSDECAQLLDLLEAVEAGEGDDRHAAILDCLNLLADQAVIYPLLHLQSATAFNRAMIDGGCAMGGDGLYLLDAATVVPEDQ